MKKVMHVNLVDHYKGSVLRLLNIAVFLDPRSKILPFLPYDDRLDVIAFVETETLVLEQNIT